MSPPPHAVAAESASRGGRVSRRALASAIVLAVIAGAAWIDGFQRASRSIPCLEPSPTHAVQVIAAEPIGVGRVPARDHDIIRRAVADADYYLAASGPGHRIRWVCSDEVVDIAVVRTPPVGVDGVVAFPEILQAVAAAGHDRRDRLYAIFYPATAGYDAVGEATGGGDRSQGPQYALMANWTGYWTLHELGHALGAVPFEAPHQYRSGHCLEQNDVMCRRIEDLDEPGDYEEILQLNCPHAPQWLFDCNNDDYYLHNGDWWDVADSPYLYLAPPEHRPARVPRDGPATNEAAS